MSDDKEAEYNIFFSMIWMLKNCVALNKEKGFASRDDEDDKDDEYDSGIFLPVFPQSGCPKFASH